MCRDSHYILVNIVKASRPMLYYIMKRFWDFLRKNIVYAIIGTTIYWGTPHIVVTLLGIFISNYFFTLYLAVFGVQVALPAIPIIIGISLGIKGITMCFKKTKKGENKNGRRES